MLVVGLWFLFYGLGVALLAFGCAVLVEIFFGWRGVFAAAVGEGIGAWFWVGRAAASGGTGMEGLALLYLVPGIFLGNAVVLWIGTRSETNGPS